MKNSSSHSGKGKSWGSLTGKRSSEYEQSTVGAVSHKPCGKSGFFLGKTKGNKDFTPERSSGVSMGHGRGPHKAGG
jgi:hypothetical protein